MRQNMDDSLQLMTDSYITTHCVRNENEYIAGYAHIEKKKCEIHNFISPTLRILHFLQGSSDWMIDGRIVRFDRGDVVLFNNICKRNIHRLPEGRVVYDMIDFYPSVLSNANLWLPYFSEDHIMVSENDEDEETVAFFLERLKAEIMSGEDTAARKDAVISLIKYLSILFLRSCKSTFEQIHPTVYQVAKCVQYIAEHLSEDLKLEKLAAHLGYSSEHLSRLFKRYTGLSPTQYIINSRLDNTMRLIQDERMNVLDAALKSGFRNASSFYKSFQTYRGTSPMQYLLSQNGAAPAIRTVPTAE